MCGIGGILRVWPHEQRAAALRTPHDQSIRESWLDIIDDSIRHRGPDGHGRFRDRAIRPDGCVVDVALVHRRLSIIDHAGGAQPMVLRVPKGALSASSGSSGSVQGGSAGRPIPGRILTPEELVAHNRRVVAESHVGAGAADPELALGAPSSQGHDHIAVVFNGCIYNHRELRAELQRAGHIFSSDHSDTEVLVHGWREWGEGLFDHLDGMYALAIWDRGSGRLLQARDIAGEKPLYNTFNDAPASESSIEFLASTASGVLRAYREYSASAMGNAASAMSVLSPKGCLRNGFSLDHIIYNLYQIAPTRVSETSGGPLTAPLPARGNRPVVAGELDRELRLAVESRLQADVPIGVFLSGGIDSSLIALYATQARGRAATFCVKMMDSRYDESDVAATVARRIGSDHQTLTVDAHPAADLERLLTQLGLPFGDSSLLPTYWVSAAAKQHVAVALAGDGGDEVFGGYERYIAERWLNRAEVILQLIPQWVGYGAHPKSIRSKMARLGQAARYGYPELLTIFGAGDYETLCNEALPARTHLSRERCHDPLRRDFETYLGDDLFRKSDTASMAVALETRAPLVAANVLRCAFAAPMSSLMPRGQRKGLLRQVARKYLPAEIVDRPKMGFAIPIGEWFRSDYGGLRTMLLDHLNSTEPFGPPSLGIDLNMSFVRQMLDEHLGTGPSGLVKRDHSQRLYMLLVLSIWAKWMGGLAGSSPRV